MKIQEQVPLKDKNWFKTGGPARYFCEPATAAEFQEALEFAQQKSLNLFVLGNGANIVVSDDGFDGLVIRPAKTPITLQETSENTALVTVGAGVLMDELIEYTLNNNLIGLEIFSGIPGTIGGSVYINLHYFEAFLSHFLVHAQVIDVATKQLITVDNTWFNFGYDQSTLMNKKQYLVSATLELKRGSPTDAAYAKGRRFEIIRHRASRYPKSNTCGSFFRNFLDDEVTLVWEGKKMRFIAYYLDKIGVKGCERVGGVTVSYQHANMLVNDRLGSSNDIVQLARRLQEKVKKEFNILPQPECIFVGFKEYPLLTQ